MYVADVDVWTPNANLTSVSLTPHEAPPSPCKQPRLVSTFVYVVVCHH